MNNKYPHTTAYKIKGNNNWCGDCAFSNLDKAKTRFNELKAHRNYSMIAIFPTRGWNYGMPTMKARYLIDRRDKSNARINSLEGLINSKDSSWF